MADLIFWSDKYNLGVEVIDAQHKKMIEIINALYRSLQVLPDKEVLRSTIDELIQYADMHFSTEEKYFNEFKYAGKEEHTREHEAYREKVNKFSKAYYENEVMFPFEMMDFLGEWWVTHILGEDREYVDCFHQNGLR